MRHHQIIVCVAVVLIGLVLGDQEDQDALRKERVPSTDKRLVVIMVEGLANWFLDDTDVHGHGDLSGFRMIEENGIRADYLLPEFVTQTLPNVVSMFTGTHPSSHGITGDIVTMRTADDEYTHTTLNHRNNGTVDTAAVLRTMKNTSFVWEKAIAQEVHTKLYEWKLCPTVTDVEYLDGCTQPSGKTLGQLTANILEDLTDSYTRLIIVNIVQVARAAIEHGTHSHATTNATTQLANDLLNAFTDWSVWEDTSLLVVSDRGLASTAIDRYAFFDDHLDRLLPHYTSLTMGMSHMLVYPRRGHRAQLVQELTAANYAHCSIYTEETKPRRWQTTLDTAVLILCEPGYGIACRSSCQEHPRLPYGGIASDWFHAALDGHDNAANQMKAVFMARGAHFSSPTSRVPWLRTIDVAGVICTVLDMECGHAPDKYTHLVSTAGRTTVSLLLPVLLLLSWR